MRAESKKGRNKKKDIHLRPPFVGSKKTYPPSTAKTRSFEAGLCDQNKILGAILQGKELLRRLSVGRLPAKRPLDWDWDVPQRRPRRRPRLDYVPPAPQFMMGVIPK